MILYIIGWFCIITFLIKNIDDILKITIDENQHNILKNIAFNLMIILLFSIIHPIFELYPEILEKIAIYTVKICPWIIILFYTFKILTLHNQYMHSKIE